MYPPDPYTPDPATDFTPIERAFIFQAVIDRSHEIALAKESIRSRAREDLRAALTESAFDDRFNH